MKYFMWTTVFTPGLNIHVLLLRVCFGLRKSVCLYLIEKMMSRDYYYFFVSHIMLTGSLMDFGFDFVYTFGLE